MSNLIVHQIPSAWGLPTIGPFSLKLETYLRIVGIPYDVVFDATPFSGPKRKLPWIEHDGKKIGDSGFIIEYLQQRFGSDPNVHLSSAERAIALSMRRLLEENLYWTLVFDRWMVDENWPLTQQTVLGMIPPLVRAVIAPIARRGVRRQLAGHGIGLHSADEIHAIGIEGHRCGCRSAWRQAVSVGGNGDRGRRGRLWPVGEHHARAGEESDQGRGAAAQEPRRLRRTYSDALLRVGRTPAVFNATPAIPTFSCR